MKLLRETKKNKVTLSRVTTFGTANGMRFPTSLKGQGYRYTPT